MTCTITITTKEGDTLLYCGVNQEGRATWRKVVTGRRGDMLLKPLPKRFQRGPRRK